MPAADTHVNPLSPVGAPIKRSVASPSPDKSSLRLIGFGLGVFLALVWVYGPALHGSFLWDDDGHVTKPALRSLAGLGRIWIKPGATQQYYPLLHSFFWLEHRLWGDSASAYHLANLILHALAATLLVGVLRELFRPPPVDARPKVESSLSFPGLPWATGLLFAFHPVCVESVAWISEQKNTLSAVFYLSAAWTFLAGDRLGSRRLTAASFLLFVAALLSKTVTSTLPAALLVVYFWREGWDGVCRQSTRLLPMLAFGVAAGLFTAHIERVYFIDAQLRLDPSAADFALNAGQRCLLAARAATFYLTKILLPTDLVFIYPRWVIDSRDPWSYLCPGLWLAILVTLGWVARQRRGPLMAVLVFLGTLFPALGFFDVYPFRFSYVADHFQYLACIPILLLAVAGWSLWFDANRRSHRRVVVGLTLAVLAGVLGASAVASRRQSAHYRDAETLYRSVLALNHDCWMAHANLGLIMTAHGPDGLNEAIEHFNTAIRLAPENGDLHAQLGAALSRVPGRGADAIAEYRAALEKSPNHPIAHLNLGLALLATAGGLDAATAEFRTAVRLDPARAKAHEFLGLAECRQPATFDDGVRELETALRLDPDSSETESTLAIALAGQPGRLDGALVHFHRAVELDPDSAPARFNLARAMAAAGRTTDAVRTFREVLTLDPTNEAARQWLDWLGDGNELSIPGQMPPRSMI